MAHLERWQRGDAGMARERDLLPRPESGLARFLFDGRGGRDLAGVPCEGAQIALQTARSARWKQWRRQPRWAAFCFRRECSRGPTPGGERFTARRKRQKKSADRSQLTRPTES